MANNIAASISVLFVSGLLSFSGLLSIAEGHGRMLEPPSRESAWRRGFSTPINYDDHGRNCGGRENQWNQQGGKCGICGDPWQGPRDYERPGGRMVGPLVITRYYNSGHFIPVIVEVTVNHRGWFEFRLCDVRQSEVDDLRGEEATQACLDRHLLQNEKGDSQFYIGSRSGEIPFNLLLPQNVTCPHCVLQWKWHCGNSPGYGKKQEEFYACADVTII